MKIMCTTQIILVLSVLMMVGPVAARAEDGSAKPASASGSRAEPAPDLRKMTPDEFKAALAKSADPVALASKYANLRGYDDQMMAAPTAKFAMDVLAEHWQDPRARAILEQIAKGEPKDFGELGLTAAGWAANRLTLMDALRERHKILDEIKDPKQIMEKIRTFFKEHPKWLRGDAETGEERCLASLLIEDAEKAGGDEAVDLVVDSEWHDIIPAFVKRHPEAALAYAKKIGRERTLGNYEFLESLRHVRLPGTAPLLEKWVTGEMDAHTCWTVVGVLSALPGGQERLIGLLTDPRKDVYLTAASYLARSHASAESLDAIRAEIKRRKAQGAPQDEVRRMEEMAQDLEKKLASSGKGGKQ